MMKGVVMAKKLVFIGDSVFDNDVYVGHAPSHIDRVKEQLTNDDEAALFAVDGSVTRRHRP
jgi:hypothetical protein